MSYLVLARKYRPQTFAEIVGQEHVTRTLANAFAKGRVHHAFLFCGARGVGKTTAARVLAKALCCVGGPVGLSPTGGEAERSLLTRPTATPCGVCDPCVTIANGTAVDYFEIDGASNNGVDDIRELRDGVRYQPAQLRRKIYVIDEVHMLSVAAFNALLKTLEEPPPHVTFIFATTEVHKIPVTILSRCQRYDFKLVPTSVLRAHLESILTSEKIPVEKGALALLAREAGGSVRDALSLTDQVIAYTGAEPITEARAAEVLGVADRGLLQTLLGSVLGGDPRGALLALESAVGRGVDLSHLARSLLGALRDAAVVQSIPDPEGLVDASAEEIDAMRELVRGVPRPHLIALFDRFARACEELRESPSPRLLVEVALLDMAQSEPLVPVAELVERLESLEGRVRKGAPTTAAPARASRPSTAPTTPIRPAIAAPPVAAASEAPAPPAPPAPAPPAPPPKPAPAPKPAPYRAPTDPMAEWTTLLAGIEKRSKMLAGIYHTARLLSWTDRALELGAPGGMAADPENLKELKRIVGEIVGAPLDVKVKTEAAAGRSLLEVENEKREAERKRQEDEARAHPVTEKVIETFGASIKEIKFDG